MWAYFGGQAFIIIIGALIPIITVLSQIFWIDTFYYQFTVAGLGALIVIAGGVLSLRQYLEGFGIYSCAETLLKSEKRLYQQACGPYSDVTESEKWNKFVQNVEQIICETEEERLSRYRAVNRTEISK